jgi:hypothetical protein
MPIASGVPKRDDKTARCILETGVLAAPGVDVHIAVRRDRQMPGMPEIVCKHSCTESGWQCDVTIALVTLWWIIVGFACTAVLQQY